MLYESLHRKMHCKHKRIIVKYLIIKILLKLNLHLISRLARRKFKKQKNIQQRPTLPKDTKLITCPIRQSNSCGKSGQIREWIMNPNGKSYVCILHDYVQRALKNQPVYTFKELGV